MDASRSSHAGSAAGQSAWDGAIYGARRRPEVLTALRYVGALLALAIIYVVAARLGLVIDSVASFATLIWAPTGIALAALIAGGTRMWPAVFAGALVINLWTGAPVLAAFGIAFGNTLEAVVGAAAVRRIAGFRSSLDRVQDVMGLILVAAILSTTISATIGVGCLELAGAIAPSEVVVARRAWWLGDLVGALVVAPLLLVWLTARPRRVSRRRATEAALLVATVLGVNAYIFGGVAAGRPVSFEQTYLVFPPLIWAALRFGQFGAVTASFLTTIVAVWGTVAGHGPFASAVVSQGLFALQTFIAVATATFLVLGALVAGARRTQDWLRSAREIAENANRAKSEFLAVMSHELRTPLNAVAGYVDLLDMELAGPLTPKQREFLSRVQNSQQHLLGLIEEVLAFTRLEMGRLSFSVQPVIVYDAIVALERMLEPELRRKQLTFTHQLTERSLAARADPEKLRQILLNLVANGVKFTPDGGRISVGAERDHDRVRLWVSDTGIGIPAQNLDQVFEPFFQVDQGSARKFSGMGLGLSIARDLARAMDGDVWLESTPGYGSTAWLVLPAA